SSSAALMFRYGHLPSSSQSESGICRCLASKVGLGELNMGGGGIGPISLNGIGGSGSSDSIRWRRHNDRLFLLNCLKTVASNAIERSTRPSIVSCTVIHRNAGATISWQTRTNATRLCSLQLLDETCETQFAGFAEFVYYGSGDRKGPTSCNPLFVPRAREPIVTGENSGGGGGAFSFYVRVPPPAAIWREGAVEANGRTEVEGKFAVLRSGLRHTRREGGEG
ncbi:hypothetical protein ALC60_09542, partial [Trachymyrmex zeteki]